MPKSKYSEGLEGTRFNRTVIQSYSHRVDAGRNGARHYWNFLCDCGTEHVSDARSAFRGMVQSCGCLNRDGSAKFTKHGHTRRAGSTPEWRSWHKIRGRVNNPKNEWFHRYGGRGIRYCVGFNDFTHFLKVIGPRPLGRTVDRINNDGHYSCGECTECLSNNWPMNVRWATTDEQNSNKRTNRILELNGKRQALFLWAKEIGISPPALRKRLRKWSVEKALTTPKRLLDS